ncbi:MAG TPA: methyl-accepting chemotaxis protein, partial [Bacteroidota bacterium]|nr:methyl-accepting chemotaxis protein [Bacteroidota bacterium]
KLYVNETVPIGEIGRIAKDFQRIRANIAFLLLASAKDELDHDHQVVLNLTRQMDTLNTAFSGTISSREMQEVFDNYIRARATFLPLQDRIMTTAMAGKKDEAKTLFLVGDARTAAHDMESAIDRLMDLKRQSGEASIQNNRATTSSATLTVAVFFLIGVVAAVTLAFVVTRSATRTLSELVRSAEAIAHGDLTVSIVQRSADETGQLAGAFGQMAANLRETLQSLEEVSAAVASASSEISSSTEQMAAGAQEQTNQAGEVASAVEEMTKTIVENSRNALATAETAKTAKSAAEEGGKVVQETIIGMKRIADAVEGSATTVRTLGASSDQIGEIIGVIDDIADQTNLLALNAAIEAARAGDQGRGFAVVADEVRKLAERTTKATKEIAAKIKTIQAETAGAVSSMEKGTKEVAAGISLADRAGASLTEIVGGAQKVTEMVSQIAAASEEQSSASEQISKNVEAISTVTGETAAGTEQIAKAAGSLNHLTDTLRQILARFTLPGSESRGGDGSSATTISAHTPPTSDIAVRANGTLVPRGRE